MSGALGIDAHRIVFGAGHLAGHKAAPDQAVELVLLGGQVAADRLRVQPDIGGPDGLMGVLGLPLGLEAAGAAVVVFFSVAPDDEVLGGVQRVLGQAQGVGTHIGDEADHALALDLHALVELLGDGHGAPGGHVELAGGLLLEGGGDEGRRGIALLHCPLDAGNGKFLVLDVGDNGIDLRLAVQLALFLIAVVAGDKAAGLLDPVQSDVQGPVLLGDEIPDLLLPIHHQTGGDGLDASRAQTPADLFPQQGAELIAHDPVQDAAGLLGVHQVHIDAPGLVDGLGDHAPGDLVEGDAAGLAVGQVHQLLQVPGDGLPFPVRVGGEIDGVAAVRGVLELVHQGLLALDLDIVGLEIVLDVHAQGALGQVAQVAHAGLDQIFISEVFADRLRLGGRLDDHQIGCSMCHGKTSMLRF